jgi:hypothetical protein
MAITRTLTEAIPYENTSDEIERWSLGMTYSQGTEGEADYYESSFRTTVEATETDFDDVVTTNFTELDKATWSLADLEALCPTSQWDVVFDSQYDSVITNPPEVCAPDNEFEIPDAA